MLYFTRLFKDEKKIFECFFFFGAYYLLQVHSSRNSSQERISRCEVKNCSWRAKEQIWVKIYTVNRNEKRLYADVCTYLHTILFLVTVHWHSPKKFVYLMCACTLVPVCNNSSLILFCFIMNWYILLVTFIWWKTHQLIGWINISFSLSSSNQNWLTVTVFLLTGLKLIKSHLRGIQLPKYW